MAFNLTNLLATLDSSIAALDSASELLEVLQAINVTNSTKGHGKTQRKYYTSYASLPAADSAIRGMTAVVSTSQVDSGNGLYLCTGTTWTEIQDLDSASSYSFQGTNFGYSSGGKTPVVSNVIDKFPFASNANASDVGDLTLGRYRITGHSSAENGYTAGGIPDFTPAPSYVDTGFTIDKFPFATDANATDVGDLTISKRDMTGQSSTTNGYVSGGRTNASNTTTNVIEKFPFASDGNASDVGDLTVGRYGVPAGQSSTTHGYTSGGHNAVSTTYDIIDKFPFSVDANASDVGNLTVARYGLAGQSSADNGYSSGGRAAPPSATYTNIIDKFAFASDGNASDVGDLTIGRYTSAGQSSTTDGYTSGGYFPLDQNTVDKFPFSSDTNASDVGNLTVARRYLAGQQY